MFAGRICVYWFDPVCWFIAMNSFLDVKKLRVHKVLESFVGPPAKPGKPGRLLMYLLCMCVCW